MVRPPPSFLSEKARTPWKFAEEDEAVEAAAVTARRRPAETAVRMEVAARLMVALHAVSEECEKEAAEQLPSDHKTSTTQRVADAISRGF